MSSDIDGKKIGNCYVEVGLSVEEDTAELAVRLLNKYLKANPDKMLVRTEDRGEQYVIVG